MYKWHSHQNKCLRLASFQLCLTYNAVSTTCQHRRRIFQPFEVSYWPQSALSVQTTSPQFSTSARYSVFSGSSLMLNLNTGVYLTRWDHQDSASSCFGYDNSWVLAMFAAKRPLHHHPYAVFTVYLCHALCSLWLNCFFLLYNYCVQNCNPTLNFMYTSLNGVMLSHLFQVYVCLCSSGNL